MIGQFNISFGFQIIIEKTRSGVNLLHNSELNYIPIANNCNLPVNYDKYLQMYYVIK